MKVFISFLLFALLFCLSRGTGISQSANTKDPYALITSAYQQGQFLEAEKQLRGILGKNPSDIQALSLLGIVLDTQKKFEEAEVAYLKAIELVPASAALQNNLGNHYLSQGDTAKAQLAYQRTLKLEPRHPNANLQLAQILADRKEFAEADRRIKQLSSKETSNPSIQILQARIYHGMGHTTEARNILAPLETRAAKDLRLTFSLGLAYVSMEQYKEAEDAFTRVLQADPTNFDVLYNLGFAALRGNHFERAEEVFNRALQQKPKDVDSMVGMARTLLRLNKYSQSLATLVRASQSAPQRSDILLLMAEGSFKMGYYGDTAIAYDKYLKLKPNDDNARRERGFALARSFRVDEGLQDLEWYVRKHPKEPWGHFELAAAQSLKDANQALKSINMVLSLDPNFHEALYARGMLYLKLERASEAIPDFKSYLDHDPKNVQAMEQMGRALMKINQPGPAAEYLEKAIAQTPDNGNLYFQYSRALRALGRHREVTEALAKFKQYGGGKEKVVPRPGLYDYLALSPAEQKAEHLKDLETAIGQRPSDPDIKLRLAEEYLRRGKDGEAMALIEQIRSMPLESFDVKVTARAGRLMLDYQQPALALYFLEFLAGQNYIPEDVLLDYFQAVFLVSGSKTALEIMEKRSPRNPTGDYYLLRAKLLDNSGQFEEAVASINKALQATPSRPDFYLQASLFLVKHEKFHEALNLLRQSEKFIAPHPDLLLLQAIVLEMVNFSDDAGRLLEKAQSLWPEWYVPYLIHGIILENQHQAAEARQRLETAVALGGKEPAAYFYLAMAYSDLNPKDNAGAYKLLAPALELNPADPYAQTLAGKLNLGMKEYAKAKQHLDVALRLQPDLSDAHWTLANVYRMTGEQEKQQAELAEVNRLNKLKPAADTAPKLPMKDLLFSVGFPKLSETSGKGNTQ